ncbi:hypothetical protein [Corynebacterium terpenotabidum]|uniref:hypothetical protein n=1 Tax=Corynebacterium terpenotabidum TaxID=89154 RepID=UPI00146B2947|nr:hypothetical protein [Corynebacterium terpenotabidum]
MTAPTPRDGHTVDPDTLVSRVDELLAIDATDAEEADLLEQAQRVIAEALEGR